MKLKGEIVSFNQFINFFSINPISFFLLYFLAICRELQAKAKRLARFKEELSQPEQSNLGIGNHKVPVKRQDRSTVEMRTLTAEPSDMAGDFRNGNVSSDYEAQDSSSIIIGLCPDMCPGMFSTFFITSQACVSSRIIGAMLRFLLQSLLFYH